jgi:phage RecT family recombinase
MSTDLKSRLRAARLAASDVEQHDQAPDAPAELGAVQGHEEVVPARDRKALALLAKYTEEFGEALPACVDRAVFFAAVRAAIPQLQRCTPASVRQALLACAQFGLVPDGQQAVIKAEGTTAVFVPMYRGYIELMHRSGRVESVHVQPVYEADFFEITPTAPVPHDVVHKPALGLTEAERGDVVMVYAFAWMKGGGRSQVIVLTRADAEAIRDEYSDAYQRAEADGSRSSFWHTDFLRMWEKTALRRLPRTVPMSAEVRELAAVDDAGDAGRVQVVEASYGESAALLAAADAAAAAAEAGQAPAASSPALERKRATARRRADRRGRGGVKKARGGRKAGV